MGTSIGKNIRKRLSGKYSQKVLDHAKKSATDTFKTSSKESFRKQQKQLMIWLIIKLLMKSQKFVKSS